MSGRFAAPFAAACGSVLLSAACASMAPVPVAAPSAGVPRTAAEPAPEGGTKDHAAVEVRPAAPSAEGATAQRPASSIICGQDAARVRCREDVTVEVVGVTAALRPLDSASMTADELSVLGPDSAAWIAFVRLAAGATDGVERVYVDGMPALGTVPAAMIGRITVNGDPFSAEYSGVGEARVNIDLTAPDRRWRAGLSSPSVGAGGGSPLGPIGKPISRSTSLGVSGPVPRLPLTFSAHVTQRLDARRPLFADLDTGRLVPAVDDLQTRTSHSTATFAAALVTGRVTARVTALGSWTLTDHAGIGGTNGSTTGQRLESADRAMQGTWRIAGTAVNQRGGLSFRQTRLDATADSPAPATVITGQRVTGGDELALNSRQSQAWAFKHVIEAVAGAWTAGVDAASTHVDDVRVPNPGGRLQLAAADAGTATWIVSLGREAAAARASSLAVFSEAFLVNAPGRMLRSGVRLDWQSRGGVTLSPRVAASLRLSGFQLTGGAGFFVQAAAPDVWVMAAQRDGGLAQTFVVRDVVGGNPDGIDPAGGESLRAAIDPAFTPRKELVIRAGVQRRLAALQLGLEHTWTRGESLPGIDRMRDAGGLVDRIGSDRSQRRHQTHVRASLRRGAQALSVQYQHVWAFDDSDGFFASPARSGDVRGEWARSAGVPRHSGSATGTFLLPFAIRLAVTAEARSDMRFNILTGFDAEGLATFTDRGGRPRNSGALPSFGKVSLSASRTVRVRRVPWLAVDVGVRADNLTNRRNVTSVGRVVGTPAFGQPIDAAAGRSIRLWVSLAR